jgi:hypothetical protein
MLMIMNKIFLFLCSFCCCLLSTIIISKEKQCFIKGYQNTFEHVCVLFFFPFFCLFVNLTIFYVVTLFTKDKQQVDMPESSLIEM